MNKRVYLVDSVIPILSVATLVFVINFFLEERFSSTLLGFFLSIFSSYCNGPCSSKTGF